MLKHRIPMGVALLACATSVLAQSSIEELRSQVARAMPPIIGNDNSQLVATLLKIQPGAQLSKNFDAGKVSRLVFGRTAVSRAPDCAITKTPAGELDDSLCSISAGKADDPTGAYTVLSFSKNISLGDIKFLKRPAFNIDNATPPSSMKKTDTQAYDESLKFLESLGIPMSEIPKPPAGAKNPLPVRSLSAGSTDGKSTNPLLIPALQKVISLPRAFEIPGGLYKDPNSGITLTHVVAPGSALVVVDDTGVQAALVQGWSDAQMDTRLDPKAAKTGQQLIDEIAQDLYSEGVAPGGAFSILIGLRQGYPNPDDPNPVFCPVCTFRPSLKVMVSNVTREKFTPTSAQPIAVPGVMREYDLVNVSERQPNR